MTEVSYRPYQERDAGVVKAMIKEAFHIDRYLRNQRLLPDALEVYLRERLAASTFTQVAVLDGRVVGVIMGRLPGHPRIPRARRNRLRALFRIARLGVTGLSDLPRLLQFFTFERVYAQLRRETSAPLDNELGLFIVDSSTRGLGVGTRLYHDFLDYLRAHGRRDFYLYTDSACTYQFYEKRGMTRAAARDMAIRLDNGPAELGVYIYTGTVDDPA